ncbi:MAG: aromatic amino acid transport family protein [Candidatus Woesearchaeota archaeon]
MDPQTSTKLKIFHITGAIFTLVGSIIGAGILGVPYLMAEAGFLTGLLVIILIVAFFMYTYLNLGEIILRYEGEHQLPGLVGMYLGSNGKSIMFIAMLLAAYGSLISYYIASGDAVISLLSHIFELQGIFADPLLYSSIFFILMSLMILKGLNIIEDFELVITAFIILTIVFIFGLSFRSIDSSNLGQFSLTTLHIPYGGVFFALMGFNAIPEAIRMLHKRVKYAPLVLILGVLVPAILYIIFSIAIVGVMGPDTQELGILGMEDALGPIAIIAGNIFILFSVTTSFLAMGFAQKNVFSLDYNMPKTFSWFLACGIPFLIFLSIRNFAGFVDVMSVTGSLFGGVLVGMILIISYMSKNKSRKDAPFTIPMNLPVLICLLTLLFLGMVALLF